MAYNRTQARNLLTSPELELFEASLADAVKAHTPARLRSKITRARKLRDKYQDLLRRQKVATRTRTASKGGRSGLANERTGVKAQIFSEVLARFEKRMSQLEVAQARADKAAATAKAKALVAAKKSAQSRTRTARKAATVVSPKAPAKRPKRSAKAPKLGPTTESARVTGQARKLQASRTRPIQGHIASAGRRQQARRDKR